MSHRQRLTLLAAILGSAVAAIDGSIVNVALPAIERDLGGGLSAQQWVSNAYLLTLGSLILIGGSLGDIYGERRIFTLGARGLRCLLRGLRVRADDRVPDRCPGLSGRGSGAADAGVSRDHRRGVRPEGAWRRDRVVDGLGWHRGDHRATRGRVDRRRALVAVDLRAERPARDRDDPAGPRRRAADAPLVGRRIDLIGAALGALGLAGIVFALIEQPHYGWSSPVIAIPLVAGIVSLGLFLAYERRVPEPMLKLDLFARRNFAVGNLETLAMYAGIAILFFYLTIYLQEVAGYSALESGLATVPVTIVMFMLSRRFGALADRYGPRLFMGAGPLIAAAGIFLLARMGMNVDYLTDVLPAMLIFAIGLSLTVAPLTATILADADQEDAGIASAVNNAVARVAGLIGVSIVGIIVAGSMVGDTFAANAESVRAFQHVMMICGGLVAAAGVIGSLGITNPSRRVKAEQCAGGQFVGAPLPAAGAHEDVVAPTA